jgi:antitoxin ParD1/3/4
MNISLPEALKAFVDEQVSRRGYGTSSEYVRALIHRDQDQTRLRELLLAGAESAPGPTADAAWFDGLLVVVKELNMTQRVTDPDPVYTLEELLQGIAAKNRHEETPWGDLPIRATPRIRANAVVHDDATVVVPRKNGGGDGRDKATGQRRTHGRARRTRR